EGKLAGSNITILEALHNALKHLKISLKQALPMTSTNAAEYIKKDNYLGRIHPKFAADFIVLNPANYSLESVYKDGKKTA
ncbi:MAG: amidohydrolase family protein, partial [Silvanigrellaceae bacterium]|nr:amidohydrolase family protein [Silvanigrellaceae bacterium]